MAGVGGGVAADEGVGFRELEPMQEIAAQDALTLPALSCNNDYTSRPARPFAGEKLR